MDISNFYTILIVCNALDIATGLIKAVSNKKLESAKLREGATHKAMIWCVVIASYFASKYVGFDLTRVTLGYYIIMELVSVVENAAEFVPVPEQLKKYLVFDESQLEAGKEKKPSVNIIAEDNDDNISQFFKKEESNE